MDGFLCSECGLSRFMKLDVGLFCKLECGQWETIMDDADRLKAESAIDAKIGELKRHLDSSSKMRTTVEELSKAYSSGIEGISKEKISSPDKVSNVILALASI